MNLCREKQPFRVLKTRELRDLAARAPATITCHSLHRFLMTNNRSKATINPSFFNHAVKIVHQYIKFGLIGVLATVVHIGLFIIFIEWFQAWEILANLIAYCAAVMVSFLGNSLWTFKASRSNHEKTASVSRTQLIRFWVTSLAGLILNTVIVFVVIDIWIAPYYYAIALMVTLTPILIFITSKLWVFR
jgi:putative flippase GtrA